MVWKFGYCLVLYITLMVDKSAVSFISCVSVFYWCWSDYGCALSLVKLSATFSAFIVVSKWIWMHSNILVIYIRNINITEYYHIGKIYTDARRRCGFLSLFRFTGVIFASSAYFVEFCDHSSSNIYRSKTYVFLWFWNTSMFIINSEPSQNIPHVRDSYRCTLCCRCSA